MFNKKPNKHRAVRLPLRFIVSFLFWVFETVSTFLIHAKEISKFYETFKDKIESSTKRIKTFLRDICDLKVYISQSLYFTITICES